MKKIDYKEYNKLTRIDKVITATLDKNNQTILLFKNAEDSKLYYLNILTIIYLTKEYNKHYQIKDKELEDLYKKMKNVDPSDILLLTSIIKTNIKTINELLRKFYLPRNYIYPKYCNEVAINRTKGKKILLKNPFFINNHIEYFSNNRISEEEKIINNVIEYYEIARKVIGKKLYTSKILKLTKQILEQNLEESKLKQHILFVISNVYQEILENKNDEAYQCIKQYIEQENYDNDKLVDLFQTSDMFSEIILSRFLSYNIDIKNGRLQELQTKQSYQYAKKIYKK